MSGAMRRALHIKKAPVLSCIYHALLSHCSAFTESLLHADTMQIALHAHFILSHDSFQEESCIFIPITEIKFQKGMKPWKYFKGYNDFIPPFLVLHTSPLLLPSLLTLFLVQRLIIDTSRGIQTQTLLYSYWFPVGKTDVRVLFQWSGAEIVKRGTKDYGIQRMGEDSSAYRGLKTYFNGSFATLRIGKSSSWWRMMVRLGEVSEMWNANRMEFKPRVQKQPSQLG